MIRKVGYRVYPYDRTSCSPAGEAAGRRRPVSVNVGWCSVQTIRIRCDGQSAACICCRSLPRLLDRGRWPSTQVLG